MKGLGFLIVFSVFYLLLMLLFQDVVSEPRIVRADEPPHKGLPLLKESTINATEDNEKKSQPANGSDLNEDSILGKSPGVVATSAEIENQGHEKISNPSSSAHDKNQTNQQPQVRAQPQQEVKNSSLSNNPLVQMFPNLEPGTNEILDSVYGSYSGEDQCTRKVFCMLGNNIRQMPGRDLLFLFTRGYIPTEYSIYYDILRNAASYGQNCEVYICKVPEKQTAQTSYDVKGSINEPPKSPPR